MHSDGGCATSEAQKVLVFWILYGNSTLDENNSVLIEVRQIKFGTSREFVQYYKFLKYHRYKYTTIENIKGQIWFFSCWRPKYNFSELYFIATWWQQTLFNEEISLLFFTTIIKLYVGRISSAHFTYLWCYGSWTSRFGRYPYFSLGGS